MTEKISVKKFLVFGIAIFIFWLVFMPRLAFADCLDRDAFFDFDSFLTGATWMNWQGEINNCVDNRVIVTRDDKGITGLRIWMDRDGRKDKHWIAPIFNTVRFDGREVISSKGEGYHCYDHCPGGPDNVIEFECPDGEFLKGFKFVRVRDGDGYKHGFAFSYKCGTLEGSGGYWQCKPYYMYGDVRDGDSPDMAKHGLEGYCVSHWDALNGGGKDWDDSGTFEIGANKIFTGVAWLYDFWPSGGWSDFFSFNFRYKEATQSVLIHYGGRIGIQLSDDGCSSQFGSTKYTPWASNGGGWSDWASDSNNYDPDCIKLKLEPETFYSQGKDFRICVQLSDKSPGSHSGATKCTPWASDGGGWSDWASDDNREDPDYIRVQLQTRDLPDDKYIKDWRIGIQLSDDGCSSQFGTTKYTPWASDGGGWSFWTTDDYGNDPDCVKVYLGAQVGTVSQVTISGTVRDNNGNPLSGVRLDLCHDMSATTNSNGYWSKIVNKCQPFCVRIDNSSLDSVVPGWTSHTPNYEWQKAGTYCAQSNECECADEEKEHDRPSDSGYDFVVTVPSGKPTVDCTSITCDSNNVVTVDFTVDTKDGVIADYWLQGKIDNASWKDMKPYCPYVASCSPDSVGECCYTYSQSGNIFYYTFKYKGEFGHTYNFRGKINNNAQWSDWAECKEYQCRSQNLTKPSLSCISNTCPNNIVSFKWKANPYGKNIDDFKLDIKEGNKPWQVLLTGVTNQNCYSDCYCPVNSSCYNDFKDNYSPSQGQLAYIYWTEGDEIIFWFKYGGKENTSYKFKGKIKTEHGWSDWAECETTWCGGPPVPQTCSDGTPYGQCSQTKPKYCDNGRLIDKCSICGCPPSYVCQKDGNCAQVGEEVKIDVDASQSLGKIPNIYKWGAWWEDAGYEGSLFIQHRMKEKFINECDNIGIVHDSVIAGAIGYTKDLENALNFINNSELGIWKWGREIREKGGKFGIYIYGCCTTPKWLSSCEEDKCEKEIEIQGGDKQEIYSCAPPRFKDDSNDKYYGLEWKEIVQAIVKKAKEEIGPGVYYFIGHEPEPSWYDTEESFFEFYKYTRRYIKEIDPEAKVGGFGGIGMHSGKSSPALVENGWQDPRFWGADNDNDGKPDPVFKNFLRYLGENNIDIDFINWHSFAIPPDISAQKKDKEEIQDWLEEVGLDKNTEIILSDWHFWPNDCSAEYEEKSGYYRFPCPKIDTEIPGSYYISAVMAMDEGGFSNDLQGFDFDVRGWMADSVFPDPIVFKGDWSIYTKYGIIKPEFYALQLLANIGKERVKTEISTSWWKYNFIDVSAISAKDDGILKILISNYIPRGEHAFLLLLRVLAKELGCKEASDIKECVLNNFPQEVSECVKNNQLKECLLNCLQNPKCYEQITPQGKEAIEKAFEMDRLIKRLQKSPRDVYITVKGLSQGTYTLKTYLIDKDHANSCRYNKKTEPTPTDLPCGIDGNIDIRVKQAKEDAGNIAKQQARGFLINKGYSDRDINYIFSGIEHCKGNITCFKNLVERCYQQSDRCINHPQTCSFDIIWNELTEACNFYQNVFHNLFYYGKYETITIPDYIDKINNDPNVSLEGSEKEKTITIGEDRTYKETIEMQPYSVYLLLFIPSSQTCSDGTPYGECSSEKPKHCNNGKLIDKCDICGCPEGYTCQANGSCISLPVPTQCIGDINNDKRVDIYDLIILITHWGQENTADLNNDKTVNLEDLIILLTHWGEICEDQCQIQGDVDNNGEVNCDDLDCVLGVILEEKSLEECPCSDVNKDGEINQLDVSKEIDILLSKGIECGKCKQCSDCGKGLFNICDRKECLSCQEKCYFINKTTGGICLSCSSASSCQDYQDDKITCQTDPCGFGNCKWENDKCISE